MRLRLVALFGIAASLLACTPVTDGRTDTSDLTDRPAPIPGTLARCAVVKGSSTDPFFRTDTLTCTPSIADGMPLTFAMTATITPAHGDSRSVYFTKEAPGTLVFQAQSNREDAYPLTLTFEALVKSPHPSASDVQQLAGTEPLKQSVTIASPTAEAVELRLPYDFWPITVRSNETAFLEIDERDTQLAPWTREAATNANIVAMGQRLEPDGRQVSFMALVPTGTSQVPFHVKSDRTGRVDGVIDGPGAYSFSREGFVSGDTLPPSNSSPPVIATTSFGKAPPETFLACESGAATLDGEPVSCTVRSVDGVDLSGFLNLVNADGELGSTVQLASGSVLVGSCRTKPCSLDVTLDALIGKNHVSASAATPLDGASTLVRLPFDVWNIPFDPRGKKVFEVKLTIASTPAPHPWTHDALASTFSSPTGPTLAIATPIGTTSIAGSMRSIDKGPPARIVDAPPFTLTRDGKYQVSDAFAVEAAP